MGRNPAVLVRLGAQVQDLPSGPPDAGRVAGPGRAAVPLHEALADPIVTDVVLHESGWFDRFLADRGPLPPEDEALLAQARTGVERTVYEVVESRPGTGVTVRDLRTGDALEVRERSFSRQARCGALVCARAVPDGQSHQFIGGIFAVTPGRKRDLLNLLDETRRPEVAGICRGPAPAAGHRRAGRSCNRRGDPPTTADGSILIEVDTAFFERVRSAALAGLPGEPVAFAYLFGSRATGGAREASDTDIAVLPTRGLNSEQRAALRNRIAEIVEPAAGTEVDVVLLDEASLPLRGRVLSQRQVLYGADEPLRVRWESLTGRMYADSRIKLDLLDRDLLIETAAGRR